MQLTKYAEKHIILFYIIQIIVAFSVSSIFDTLGMEANTFLSFLIKIVLLSCFTFFLLFLSYGYLTMKICGHNYQAKRQIEFEDLTLTSTAIVCAFVVPDLLSVLKTFFPEDSAFLLTIIVGIPLLFFGISKIVFWIATSIN